MTITICPDIASLRRSVAAARSEGGRVGLVPTMGALHRGHLALVARAKREAEAVVVSVFVNPTQFAPGEDLAAYPRTLDEDLAQLSAAKIDIAYVPSAAAMYPQGFAVAIVPGGAAVAGLEDRFRPTHFQGVATVVAKLFLQSCADVAIFGEKDYQQLRVVTQVARDLDIPIRVIGEETVREQDGLALSSRNRYLSVTQRAAAPLLYRTLVEAAAEIQGGGTVGDVLDAARQAIIVGGFALDYLEWRDAESLAVVPAGFTGPTRLLVAARIGSTRLIDNIAVLPRR